jgi:uncharacterized protein
MKKLIIAGCLVTALISNMSTFAQSASSNPSTKQKTSMSKSASVVQEFFTAFGNGNFEALMNTFHPDCLIISVRKGERQGQQVQGTYQGKEEAKVFMSNLGAAFDTQAFAVDHLIGEGDVAFASGSFTHKLKSTGKLFSSDWALKCIIRDGKIAEYHFYEDSAAFEAANKK